MSIRIAIFASGSGSNAENIITYFAENQQFEFPLIVSNKENAYVHERARKLGVRSITLEFAAYLDWEVLHDILLFERIDYVILAGFLLKVPQIILQLFPRKIINIHPALLPKFGGKGMYGDRVHRAVRAANEKESGITIHYVTENYDEGDIIFQAKCTVLPTDTPEEIAQKVHALEYKWFPEIIEKTFIHPKEETED
ncbi:phosphoribosylglycinamide formyltransferase [Bacteroidia bacterium]|nr:phosphoribosylglycinamide formyltransferase [Bacteroidia bacterium]GHV43737.1 phosphoribosylglycinamide formyltransferase [Bacteroidia bacterium]